MSNSLLEKYRLQKRLDVIESLIIERSIGRGGEPSNAMKVWRLLTDNGPMTRQQIQSSGLSATATATASLNFYVAHNLLTKTGDRFAANPDYAWDDVGVIPRTAQQELMNSLRDAPIVNDEDEIPVETTSKARTKREPIQSRVKEVKQNLFSRKYDEVKAAIDSGQDCRIANDNGVTPLVYACRDKKNQSANIVKLLLDHGANPNDLDGKRPVIFTALENRDYDVVKELASHGADLDTFYKHVIPIVYAIYNGVADDTLLALVKPKALEIGGRWSLILEEISDRHLKGSISDSLYNAIVDKMFDGVSTEILYRHVSGKTITSELNQDVMTIANKFTSRGELPPIDPFWEWGHSDKDVKALNNYYKVLVRAANGELKVREAGKFFSYCDGICDALGKPNDFAFKFITDEWLRNASLNSLKAVVINCIDAKDTNTLIKVAKIKPERLNASLIVNYLAMSDADNKVTAAVCRILNSCLRKSSTALSESAIEKVRKTNNTYLVEYLFDRGFADYILYGIKDAKNSAELSQTVRSVIKDLGIETKDFRDDNVRRQADDSRRRDEKIDLIVLKIETDEWNSQCERYITNDPSILLDERVQKALDDNNNITSRQLKQRIARMPKDADKYDF